MSKDKDYMYMPLMNGKPAMWHETQLVFASGSNPHCKVPLYEDRKDVIELIEKSIEWRYEQGFYDTERSEYGTMKVLKP